MKLGWKKFEDEGLGLLEKAKTKQAASSRASRKLQTTFEDLCTQGHVECAGGFAVVNGTTTEQTCEAACGGACCVGATEWTSPCYRFSGTVCKDDVSCVGYRACDKADIPHVFKSCNGDRACSSMGSDGGSVGDLVSNSCVGDFSCRWAGAASGYEGAVGNIGSLEGSCNYKEACKALGYGDSGDSGFFGDLVSSCNQYKACYYGASYDSTVTADLNSCCNTADECSYFDQDSLPETCAAPANVGSGSDWNLEHDSSATASYANFTQAYSGNDGDGKVFSSWNLNAPTGEAFDFSTTVKGGACGGTNATYADSLPTLTGLSCTASSVPSKKCQYSFDKASMNQVAGFIAKDPKAGNKPTLNLCEIAKMSIPDGSGGVLDVEEVYMSILLTFVDTASFNVDSVNMSPADIQTSEQDTSLADYVSAKNCDGPNASLGPNSVLCIEISSSSADVLIEKIDSMKITGKDPSAADNELVVVTGNVAKYSAITDIGSMPAMSVEVKTRVPANEFDFEAQDASIAVSGSVTVKFAGRRLSVGMDRLLQAAEEETAEFSLRVKLDNEPKVAIEGDEEVMMNSAKAISGKAFAILGMVFASAIALW